MDSGPTLDFQPTTLSTVDGRSIVAEQAVLYVPETRPDGQRRIGLTLLRFRATTENPGYPVVFLAGGPGDSAIFWARYPQFLKAFEAFRAVGDVILLDQRGCGQSEPDLRLPPVHGVLNEAFASRDDMFRVLELQAAEALPRFKTAGIELQAYNPVDSSDDIADLADALGVDRVRLVGYSYGSHLTLTTLRRHPKRVDRVALCGFEGPDDTLKLPSNVTAQLTRLTTLAREQLGMADLLSLMEQVHSVARRKPFIVHVELPGVGQTSDLHVGEFALQHLASTWMGVSNRFRGLPRLYSSLSQGDTTHLVKAVSGLLKSWARPATFYLTDGASGCSSERRLRIRQQAVTCVLGDAVNFPFPDIGRVWVPKDLGDAFRNPVSSDTPTLVITGDLDGNTPTNQAEEELRLFPNARQVVVRNAAHNDLLVSETVHTAIVDHFLGKDVACSDASIPEPVFSPL